MKKELKEMETEIRRIGSFVGLKLKNDKLIDPDFREFEEMLQNIIGRKDLPGMIMEQTERRIKDLVMIYMREIIGKNKNLTNKVSDLENSLHKLADRYLILEKYLGIEFKEKGKEEVKVTEAHYKKIK